MNESKSVRAPEFPDGLPWLNTPEPLRLRDLRGHVVLLDFWTYCCVNCLHTLPELRAIEERFADEPVAVLGVHAAKFDNEKDPARVSEALRRHEVVHPVVVDSEHTVWDAYAIRAWPTLVLVDADGYVRDELRGETDAAAVSAKIEALLEEARAAHRLADAPLLRSTSGIDDDTLLRHPGKVAADDRHLYVADSGHHRILVCTHDGHLLKTVGGPDAGFEDGRYDTCRFREPQGMRSDGDQLYIADRGNHALRALDLDIFWTRTLAGTGELGRTRGAPDPSTPRAVALRSPWDVELVGRHLLIAMAGSHQIWLYDLENDEIGAWAGSGAEEHVDGPLQEAAFAQPSGLDLVGPYLMIADSEISSIRAIDLHEGQAQTLVGGGLFDFGEVDGDAESAMMQHPLDVAAIDRTLYVADTFNHKIRAIDLPTLTTTTVLDRGTLDEPGGLCAVGERLLVADTNHHRVVWFDPRTGATEPLEISIS